MKRKVGFESDAKSGRASVSQQLTTAATAAVSC